MIFKNSNIKGKIICHKCDVPACINPRHLFRGTHVDNVYDRVNKDRSAKGINNGRAKLVEKDVFEIIRLFNIGKSKMYLADKFSVTTGVIKNIIYRKTWKHLTIGLEIKIKENAEIVKQDVILNNSGVNNSRSKLNRIKVLRARHMRFVLKYTNQRIADRFGVSNKTIRSAINGVTWSSVS